jgi:DNA polymerase-1
VVFGISYGISDFGLARQLRVEREEARRTIEAYLAQFPGVRRYMEEAVRQARETGVVRTLFGRIRALPDIHHRVPHRRQAAERAAINTPIQGTAADIIKLAMVRLARRLRREGSRARLILQVHDELILEAPEGEARAAARVVREEMERVAELAVPLVVEVRIGPNWYELKDVGAEGA